MPRKGDLSESVKYIGKRFGCLRIIDIYQDKNYIRAFCKCDCETIKHFILNNIKRGNTVSCGHMAKRITRDRSLRHGMYNTLEYIAWKGARERCYNKNNRNYENYGGRGIEVC